MFAVLPGQLQGLEPQLSLKRIAAEEPPESSLVPQRVRPGQIPFSPGRQVLGAGERLLHDLQGSWGVSQMALPVFLVRLLQQLHDLIVCLHQRYQNLSEPFAAHLQPALDRSNRNGQDHGYVVVCVPVQVVQRYRRRSRRRQRGYGGADALAYLILLQLFVRPLPWTRQRGSGHRLSCRRG